MSSALECDPANGDPSDEPFDARLTHMSEPSETRQERKLRTRQALIDGALSLVQQSGFASLSLREVARSAEIVPTAFYRHFVSLDELAEVLVAQSMHKVREILLGADLGESTAVLLERLDRAVRTDPASLRLLASERYGGSAQLRAVIAAELRVFTADLAVDLARVDALRALDGDGLRAVADLIVTLVLGATGALLELGEHDTDRRESVLDRTDVQLRLVLR